MYIPKAAHVPGTPATPPPTLGQSNWSRFSPGGGCASAIKSVISAAQLTIDLAIYELCNVDLADALIAARSRGVRLRIVMDAREARARESMWNHLSHGPQDLRECDHFNIMHNKFAIFDSSVLLTGSYNWSNNAESSNAENLICLYDQPTLLAAFQSNFDALWSVSKAA